MSQGNLIDVSPDLTTFRAEVIRGLGKSQKEIPCKYLYDERGAQLFEEICKLPEYYPTRIELGIMERKIDQMAAQLGSRCLLIEYGSGAGIKTRVLLDALEKPAAYVPIDIACDQLAEAAGRVQASYPEVEVRPICADYTGDYELPKLWASAARRAVFFPGSTIGNFHPAEAVQFIQHVREVIGDSGALLLGVDLKKDKAILERAYNDSAGVTAAFNLNLLDRVNRELAGDVRLDLFQHRAIYNARRGRIEMHLVSLRPQSFQVAGQEFSMSEGETIHTENSYKYTLAEFKDLALRGGFEVVQVWTDPDELFSVQFLEAA